MTKSEGDRTQEANKEGYGIMGEDPVDLGNRSTRLEVWETVLINIAAKEANV